MNILTKHHIQVLQELYMEDERSELGIPLKAYAKLLVKHNENNYKNMSLLQYTTVYLFVEDVKIYINS